MPLSLLHHSTSGKEIKKSPDHINLFESMMFPIKVSPDSSHFTRGWPPCSVLRPYYRQFGAGSFKLYHEKNDKDNHRFAVSPARAGHFCTRSLLLSVPTIIPPRGEKEGRALNINYRHCLTALVVKMSGNMKIFLGARDIFSFIICRTRS